MGEMAVCSAAEEIVLELDADHITGVLSVGPHLPDARAFQDEENFKGYRQEYLHSPWRTP
jgi:hypothetical protein